MREKLPFDQGYEAYQTRLNTKSNPYTKSDWRHNEWDLGWSSAEENELSELGSLMVYPIKKLLKDAQHECEQYLWKSKKLTEKPKRFEPELVEFSDYEKSPSERHLTVVGNDESK